jgi:uncharacterized membrane protein
MAKDIQDTVRQLLMNAIEGVESAAHSVPGSSNEKGKSGSGLSGAKGVAAGVGAAALAPVAVKGLSKLVRDMGVDGLSSLVKSPGQAVHGLTSDIGDHVGSQLGDKISDKVDESGGASGILKDTVSSALPFGGGGGGGGTKGGALGTGKGRRMPVQQSVDIGIPRETVYNQWTQFEDWPTFMHRVTRVTQEDECTVSFATKIWGKTKEFTAKIDTQRPDERIKWRVSQGITHTGVVTFHELGPELTRVLLTLDVAPGGMLEKAARGMRHIKRAARGDLHRFKAFIEMQEHETGAWRGRIEDGEVVEEHDPSYDEGREYSDPEDFLNQDADQDEEPDTDQDEDGDEQEEQEEQEEKPRARRSRSTRRSSSNGGGADEEPQKGSTRRSSSSGSGSGQSQSRRSSGASASSSRGRSTRSSSSSGSSRGGGSGSSRSAGSGSSRSAGSGSSRSGRSGSSRSGGGSSSSRRSSGGGRSRSRSASN